MQVTRIDNRNINYYGKKHFLTQDMKSSVESLLIRMNAETNRIIDGDNFKSTITHKLHYGNASFEDERRFTKKIQHNKQMQGFSVLKIGKKTVLDIDNNTGEIIDFIKPFYKPWFFVLRQASKILSEMRASFYDATLLKKETMNINELTPEGHQKMKKYVLQIEKQRLENVVKELEIQ